MKILYISRGEHVDYQDDCLSIGLKELFGSDVVDINKREHIYTSYSEEATKSLYGMGMTVTRVLPDLEVDRTDVLSKIKNKYFDLVVYGSIWRKDSYLQEVLEHYPKNRIACIDGEDKTDLNNIYNFGTMYFKRELVFDISDRLLPISFAIPTCKVNFNKNKIKDESFITPLNRNTYIYKNEKDYYNDYSEARLGVTVKKAGWDCMRHYEILGNGCLPHFLDLVHCPPFTLFSFPKELCMQLMTLLKTDTSTNVYNMLVDKFENHFNTNNTTEALAKNFINTMLKA